MVSRDWYRFFLNLLNKANQGGGGGGSGTVTSVSVSGGSTGMSFSGNPVTTSGTITMSGTLDVDNGGTGATTAAGARANLGAGTVTSVDTGTGLAGGPITAAGTITFSNAGVGTWAATPSSANLAAAMTDETGSGSLVFANSPTLSGPTIDGANPYIQFNNGVAVALAAGRMWYNGSTGSWNLGMGGGNITQQVGEELFLYGKASSAISDSPLQIVYQTGTVGASGVVTFAPTVTGITDGNLIVGIATEAIATNDFGRVTTFGIVRNITTDGAAYGETWADGDVIWYNPVTGNPTKFKPSAPNIKVQVGTIISAGPGGSGSFQVEINHGSVLGGTDSNVELTSVVNANLLQYDSGLGYWKNVAPSSVTGIGSLANALTIGTGLSGTSYNGSSAVTIANTGVLSLAGTASQVTVSASTGAITISLPATINVDTSGNAATVTNGVYTTGSYADPTWITSLAGSKITGNISGNAANVTGTVAIANGGTGQTTQTAAFDALAPTTTKGDLIVSNGTDNVRQAVGADNYVLTADSAQATGVKWAPASGSGLTISNDTSTATNLYPTFASATSGAMSTIYTSDPNLLYKPSTGELTSERFVSESGFFVNKLSVDTSYTVPAGYSAMSTGTITIANGVTVTVSSGSRWAVI